jgi:hypothetical protein
MAWNLGGIIMTTNAGGVRLSTIHDLVVAVVVVVLALWSEGSCTSLSPNRVKPSVDNLVILIESRPFGKFLIGMATKVYQLLEKKVREAQHIRRWHPFM